MTEEYILSKGYKEYSKTIYHCKSVTKFFQKRFDDNIGTKYFINIEQFNFSELQQKYPDFEPIKYEYVIQLHNHDEKYMDIRFHSDWTLLEVEDFMDKQWQLGCYDYYEKWE